MPWHNHCHAQHSENISTAINRPARQRDDQQVYAQRFSWDVGDNFGSHVRQRVNHRMDIWKVVARRHPHDIYDSGCLLGLIIRIVSIILHNNNNWGLIQNTVLFVAQYKLYDQIAISTLQKSFRQFAKGNKNFLRFTIVGD